ncbi:MAG: hypothetical protein AAB505_02755 [Patescibacteria group bacterium]
MIYNRHWRRPFTLGVLVFVGLVFFLTLGFFNPQVVEGASGSTSLSGFAWSSNIGWISFKGSGPDYSYSVVRSGSYLRGFAWSSNIGWISFNDNTGAPPGSIAPTQAAGVYFPIGSANPNQLAGWARACAVFESGCSGTLKPESDLGGWDGWISFFRTDDGTLGGDPVYGVALNPSTSRFEGFAWGDSVIGWIDFCPDSATGACVTLDTADVSCTANGQELGAVVNVNEPVIWQATVNGVSNPGGYFWISNRVPPDGANTDQVISSYSSPGFIDTQVQVQDNVGNLIGTGTCSITVADLNNPKLTLYVNATGPAGGTVDIPTVGPVDGTPKNWWVPPGGCGVSSSPCLGNYDSLGQQDTLVAHPIPFPDPLGGPDIVPNYTWVGCDSGSGNQNGVCVVTMSGDREVSVSFWDPNEVAITLTANPPLVGIDFQSEGQPAESNASTITGNGSADWTRDVRVISFTSLIDGEDIQYSDDNLDDILECVWDNDNAYSYNCFDSRSYATISNSDPTATLKVKATDKLIEILNKSPYRITVGTGRANETTTVTFEYRVHDIRPR